VSLPQIDRMDQPSVKLGLGVDEIAAAGFEHGDALRLETPLWPFPLEPVAGRMGPRALRSSPLLWWVVGLAKCAFYRVH